MAPTDKHRNFLLRSSMKVLLALMALNLACCSAGTATMRTFLGRLRGVKNELDAIMQVRSAVCHGQSKLERKDEDCSAACPTSGHCVPNRQVLMKIFPSYTCMCRKIGQKDQLLRDAWQEWLDTNDGIFKELTDYKNPCENQFDMGLCTSFCPNPRRWTGQCLPTELMAKPGSSKKYQCYCYLRQSGHEQEPMSAWLPLASALVKTNGDLCKDTGGEIVPVKDQCQNVCPDKMQSICMKPNGDTDLQRCFCEMPGTTLDPPLYILFPNVRFLLTIGIPHRVAEHVQHHDAAKRLASPNI